MRLRRARLEKALTGCYNRLTALGRNGNHMEELMLGDLVQMRKTHPCGSDRWTVIRVGADIKIRCSGCSRIVMMDRADFVKRMKKIIAHSDTPIRGTNEFDEL